ncbi:MAG: saccharopine dehydrogenase family protein [Gemmatimonadales bacterium]
MRMLVLGAGLQGTACAFDLLNSTDAAVTMADVERGELHKALRSFVGDRLTFEILDVHDEVAVLEVMRRHDAVMSAIPYYFNFPMARLAVEAGVHFCDLGGNTEIVREQQTLDPVAAERGISIVPDCGLAPGMANILAVEGMKRVEHAESVKIFVGGLPVHPEPPLNYQVVYSLEGALDYYTTPSWVLRDGSPTRVDALSELEDIEFGELGVLEAFHTGGGISTMPWGDWGGVRTMEYKTLRYPGHARIMRAIRDLGLLSLDTVVVKDHEVTPRDVFVAVVDPKLRKPDSEDLVALKVIVSGTSGGKPATSTLELLDFADTKNAMSAMMRTTGYSLSITGQMQVDGRISARGVKTGFEATPFRDYVMELGRRGIEIVEK